MILNSSSSSSEESCFSNLIGETTAAFGFYTTDKDPQEINFPDVAVEVAKKTNCKKTSGPIKFIDCGDYSKCDECAIKVDGYFLTYGCIGTGVGIVCGAALGGGIGFAVGGCIPAGIVVGGVVGGVVGNRIGVYIAREESIVSIKECDEYQLWNEARIEKATKKMLIQYCAMYFPQELICPITGMIPAFPVFANDQVYEKYAIEQWLDNKNIQERNLVQNSFSQNLSRDEIRKLVSAHRRTVCPMQGKYFSKNDLVCNEDAFKKIYHCLKVNLDEINRINDNLTEAGMKKLFVALMKNKSMLVEEKIKKAVIDMNRFHIKKEYQDEVKAYLLNSV